MNCKTIISRPVLGKLAYLTTTSLCLTMFAAPSLAQQISGQSEPAATAENKTASEDEIVVTAEKRSESIQTLPVAISAFSGDTLANRNLTEAGDLALAVPSMQIDGAANGFAQIGLRGVGGFIAGVALDNSVGVSNDGIGMVGLQIANLTMFDVERVEVLRGPQGTLGGRSNSAGAVNIYSNRPTETFEGSFKSTYGSFDRLALEGYLSGPLTNDGSLLARLAVISDHDSGWVANTAQPEVGRKSQEFGGIDLLQARASLLARPSSNFEALLILEGLRDRGNYINVTRGRARPDKPSRDEIFMSPAFDRDRRTIALDSPNENDLRRYQATLRLTWDLSPNATLTAISGYVDYDRKAQKDNDGTAVNAFFVQPHWTGWQASQELTLTADLTNRLDMILGAHYLRANDVIDQLTVLPTLNAQITTHRRAPLTSWAGYTQWRYRLTDTIRLTAGVRYTHDRRGFEADNSPPARPNKASDTFTEWTPRFSVDYMPNDDLTFYATVARGYKPGGRNNNGGLFLPEFVWNYEAGMKAKWLDGRLRTALTGFYMKNSNLQQVIQDENFQTRIVSANSATIKGVELEFDARVTGRLRVTGGGTYLSAHYDDLMSADALYPELGLLDLSGNRMVLAPKWRFNVAAEYSVPLSDNWQGIVRASGTWQDEVFFDFFNHPSARQSPYALVDASAELRSLDDKWSLTAFVKNLTDKDYATLRFIIVAFGAPTVQDFSPPRPRTWGVSLRRRF